MTSPMTGLVLLSGGLDSLVCLAKAQEECETVGALTFLYGQKHVREVEAAVCILYHYGISPSHHKIALPSNLFQGSKSTLLDPEAQEPRTSYAELRKREGPAPSYVPFRNGIFLSMAAAVALSEGYDRVYFSAHADDAHNYAYPDCTPTFLSNMYRAIYQGTYMKVQLRAPFVNMVKADIVREGYRMGVPFELSYSCYSGGEKHCGECATCVSRKEAFVRALVGDPTEYEV